MAKEFCRPRRVAQEMQREISNILQHKIKDPRLNIVMITISAVEVSRDLAYAKIFVTFLNNKNKKTTAANIKILQNASGFIRFLLSKTMHLRIVPQLIFLYDNSLEEGIKLSKLVTRALKYDKERRLANLKMQLDN